jgi:hypothetical protein
MAYSDNKLTRRTIRNPRRMERRNRGMKPTFAVYWNDGASEGLVKDLTGETSESAFQDNQPDSHTTLAATFDTEAEAEEYLANKVGKAHVRAMEQNWGIDG